MQGSNFTAGQFDCFRQLETRNVNNYLAVFSVNKCCLNTQTFVVVSSYSLLHVAYCRLNTS